MKAIKVENLSKAYQLGQIGTGTISRDIERWAAKLRGKEDPFLKIGETNDRASKGESDIVWSLKDLNFEIEQGDAVGIIGRNGAGKSTLLKLLSRVTAPTTGNIKIKGRVASLLEVGTGFHPELSGRENIYLNGAILGMRKKEITRQLDEIVDFAGVERYLDTPVKRYSSGMYVRLAFAVAAHLESEILIVDEVLAVGDAEFQKKCIGKMSDVSKGKGRTVLFVSHNMSSISTLCSTSILLSNGQLVNIDKTKNIIDAYLNSGQNNSTKFINENIGKYSKIKTAQFINNDNESIFQFEDSIQLKIEGEFYDYSSALHLGLYVYNQYNQRVFSLVEPLIKNVNSNSFVCEIILRKELLLTGKYYINSEIFIPFVDKVDLHENILGFSINDDTSKMSRFKGYDMGIIFSKYDFHQK